MIRPSQDLALLGADMASWESAERANPPAWRPSNRAWVHANDASSREILLRRGASGPLPSRELPDTCTVPQRSTGWTSDGQDRRHVRPRGRALRVNAIHHDVPFTKAATAAIGEEVEDLARPLELDLAPPG